MRAAFRALQAAVIGVALLVASDNAGADPPTRVARLGYSSGPVSLSPAGEDAWIAATISRPLSTGDRLWASANARAEIQVAGAFIRMNAVTGIAILNLDDQTAQVQLTQGTLNVRVRSIEPNQVLEIDTPNLAFALREPGRYRIEVDPEGNATTVVMRDGQGEAYGEGAGYVIDNRHAYRFTGTGLRDYQYADARDPDEFDRWSGERDRQVDNSASARYVAPDVLGYEELDANGMWRTNAANGNVWIPNRVPADWVPYRDGRWIWLDPWGWTWLDDAPWGFAVSHYGRWTNLDGRWGWVPGPADVHAYYAPALVAFVGGEKIELPGSGRGAGGVAWFPLAPGEVYRPSYPVSRAYLEALNRSNTLVSTTVINDYFNTKRVADALYANRQVPGAIVAVPTSTFLASEAVNQRVVGVAHENLLNRPIATAPMLTPTETSLHGSAGPGERPPDRLFERTVIARGAPPLQREGLERFVARTANAPATDARKGAGPGAAPGAAPTGDWRALNVKVIAQPLQLPAMTAPPPLPVVAKARESKPADPRAKPAPKKAPPPAKAAAAKKPAPQATAAKPAKSPPVASARAPQSKQRTTANANKVAADPPEQKKDLPEPPKRERESGQ